MAGQAGVGYFRNKLRGIYLKQLLTDQIEELERSILTYQNRVKAARKMLALLTPEFEEAFQIYQGITAPLTQVVSEGRVN